MLYLYVNKKIFPMQIVQSQEQLVQNPPTSIRSVVNDFFDKHRIEAVRKEMWNLNIAYCGQRVDEIPVAINLADTAYFCANVSLLLDELHALLSISPEPVNEPS
jgi:hypothetical protein